MSADPQSTDGRPAPFIIWSSRYELGDAIIDRQHQRIVTVINRLYAARRVGIDEVTLQKVLNALVDYTRTHFLHEEEVLIEVRYTDLVAHRRLHTDMMRTTMDICDQASPNIEDLAQEVLTFLRDWWTDHICRQDRLYMAHVRKARENWPFA
jgi:hemerythrin